VLLATYPRVCFSVEEFRKELEKQVERGRNSSVNFRTAERFGQIVVKTTPIVFWFKKRNKHDYQK